MKREITHGFPDEWKPKSSLRIGDLCFEMEREPPNLLHRTMQRLLLGFEWTDLEKKKKKDS